MKNTHFKIDSPLLIVVLSLLVIGVVIVYSASSFKAQEAHGDSHFFLKNHFYRVLAGLFLMLLVARIDYRFWLNCSPLLLPVCVVLLLFLLFSPDVIQIRGSRRWLDLGPIVVQPSDFARLALLLFLSLSLGASNFVRPKSIKSFGFHLGMILLVTVPVVAQPDVGSALAITLIALATLFVAGERLRHFFLLAVAAVPALALLLSQGGYRTSRIMDFVGSHQGGEPAWQAQQSLIAFGNGHVFGQGLGASRQKFHFLPDPFTDFIFAILGEELGLLGTLLIIALFAVLIWSAFRIAKNAPDFQGRILATGIAMSIAVYALTNMGVVLNLIPTTGIPLPFVSYGGSAMFVNLIAVGMLLNIGAQAKDAREPVRNRSFIARGRMARKHA